MRNKLSLALFYLGALVRRNTNVSHSDLSSEGELFQQAVGVVKRKGME